MVLVMFLLPFFSASGYSIIQHTTSELGAQNTPNSWIMNITFILLGITSIIEALRIKRYYFHQFCMFIFGSSLVLAGLYSHAPISSDVIYSKSEDSLHTLFASLTGFSFTIFAFSFAFIAKKRTGKIISLLMGVIAILLSLLMFKYEDYTGLLQRLMFLTCFGWLIYIFSFASIEKK